MWHPISDPPACEQGGAVAVIVATRTRSGKLVRCHCWYLNGHEYPHPDWGQKTAKLTGFYAFDNDDRPYEVPGLELWHPLPDLPPEQDAPHAP